MYCVVNFFYNLRMFQFGSYWNRMECPKVAITALWNVFIDIFSPDQPFLIICVQNFSSPCFLVSDQNPMIISADILAMYRMTRQILDSAFRGRNNELTSHLITAVFYMQSTVLEKHASLLLQTSFFPCVFFIQHCLKIMTTQI